MEHYAIHWEGGIFSYVNLAVEDLACLLYTWCVAFRGLSYPCGTSIYYRVLTMVYNTQRYWVLGPF
jgi:hypothetical protein